MEICKYIFFSGLPNLGAWITNTHYLTISKTIALYSDHKWIYLKVPFFLWKSAPESQSPPPNFNLLVTPLYLQHSPLI